MSKVAYIRPTFLRPAVAHLAQACPTMATLVEKVGRCELRRHADPFHSLVGTVISQQISTKAAAMAVAWPCRSNAGKVM